MGPMGLIGVMGLMARQESWLLSRYHVGFGLAGVLKLAQF